MTKKGAAIPAYVLKTAAHNPFTSPFVFWVKGWGIANMQNRLTSSLDFQGQALSLRSERQRLIASNIANADTPGYVARDMDFNAALQQATGQMQGAPALSASQPGHIGGGTAAAAQANLVYSTPSQTNLDRNTVDMDRERANFADNSVHYEATLRFINSNVRTMLDAIRGQ
jgi:flagellar basal-body rod protein FlgB